MLISNTYITDNTSPVWVLSLLS